MEDKIATRTLMKRLALRGKDYTDSRIAELAALMAAGLEDVAHAAIDLTLPASGWSGGTQTVTHPAFLADGNFRYLVCAGAEDVTMDDITVDGQATLRCGQTPEQAVTVRVIRLEVEV